MVCICMCVRAGVCVWLCFGVCVYEFKIKGGKEGDFFPQTQAHKILKFKYR